MKLTINKEFLRRHLFAFAIFAGLGGYFAYDGLVTYPRTPAAELYESIEKAPPPPTMAPERLEAFKSQKITTQYGFAGCLLLAALLVCLHLFVVSRLDVSFDESGFTWRGRRYAFADVKNADLSLWEKKGIVALTLDGERLNLDAWHHTGVAEFVKHL